LGAAVLIFAGLVAVLSSMNQAPHRRPFEGALPARASTLEALGGLAEGMPLGPFQISGVTEPTDGAVIVHATSATGEVTYEVRVASDAPLPAARGGRYAVYYQSSEGGADVVAGAVALGHRLEHAGSPPLDGLTTYPFTARP
jgi:hypothetical protein